METNVKYTQQVDEKTGKITFVPDTPPEDSGNDSSNQKSEEQQRKEEGERTTGKLPQDVKEPEAQTFNEELRNSHIYPSEGTVREYENILTEISKNDGVAFDFTPNGSLNEILDTLEANNKKLRYAKRLQNGKLDGRRLTAYKTSDRLFKKKAIKHKDYQFNILIDLSGSMFGEKLVNAMNAAAKTTKALEQAGFKVSIWGMNMATQLIKPYEKQFNDDEFKSLVKMQVCSVQVSEEGYENYLEDKENDEAMDMGEYGQQLCGGTIESVTYAESFQYSKAHSTNKTRHVAIVLSDGAPGGRHSETAVIVDGKVRMVDPNDYINNRVDDLYKWWESHSEEITGYGIGLESDCQQVPANQMLHEPSKLPEVMSDLVQKIIF